MVSTIHCYRWHPLREGPQQSRGIYLLHGIGEHAGRYERLANHLTKLGYEVGAHDHPGHGQSTGKRGVLESNTQLERCAAEQFDAFHSETGAVPFLFGHSLGGLVATSMVLSHDVKVAGLLLSAPAYRPIISLKHRSAGIVTWIVDTGKRSIKQAGELSVPTLMLMPGQDVVVDSQGITDFISAAPQQYITEKFYPNCRHEILNETPERRRKAHTDIEQWLSSQE